MSVKRAKWIEGITQSRRILRDIAEIVTTAIRDENGVVPEENWQLVFPRPFAELPVTRAMLIRDENNSKKYIPVKNHTEHLVLTGTTGAALKENAVLEQSIVVKSEDGATTYEPDTDYTYVAGSNSIARTANSAIPSGATVLVEYGTLFHKILQSVPVLVERKLTLNEPDRVIPSNDYQIVDYVSGKIKFNTDPPQDAMYFALSYTERKSTFEYEEKEKVQLELDPLDGLGRTFLVPGAHGEIMQWEDYRTISSAPAGGLIATGEVGYTLDPIDKAVIFDIAPTLRPDDRLLLTVEIYDDPTFTTSRRWSRLELIKDANDPDGKTYKVTGSFQKFNEGKAHFVEMYTKNTEPILYKHLDANNAGFSEIDPSEYTVDFNNPAITLKEDTSDQLFITCIARGEDDINEGLKKITDRIVIKTVTTPENTDQPPVIGDQYGAKDTATSLEMYVEIVKPPKLINPETGLERYTTILGNQVETQDNNHFIQIRMFDKWDDEKQTFVEPTYDSQGNVIDKGAYVSDWAKYAWFKDWKESLVDELDADPGSADVTDGIILHEVITNGMSDEFPIQFWISTNNNRIAMILMGDPTLDQDNFLTSFAYIGRIHPFYDSKCVVKRDSQGNILLDANGEPVLEEQRTYFENDVSGNFALTTGSSTIPAAIGIPPKGQPIMQSVEVITDSNGIVPGDLYDFTAYSYIVTYLTDGGESRPSRIDAGRLVVNKGLVIPTNTTPTKGISLKVSFVLPEEATGYKIYRYHEASKTNFTPADAANYGLYKLVATVERLGREREITFVDDGVSLPMDNNGTLIPNMSNSFYSKYTSAVPTARSFKSVTRDQYTGAILDVKFTNKWGAETATGVNDIMMFQTRSGLKYQRHQAAFITTEQFMRKEKSGQSRWTGKFHLSPIYVEHSYDKQRGWLDGVMAVDDSGIEHLDELIVDKDTPTEEVYKFFRINAPFSFLNNSPNYAYGVAIIKSSQKWQ